MSQTRRHGIPLDLSGIEEKKKERAVHRSLRSYRMNNRENGIGRLHGRGQIMPKDELI
jgi:hypothetical protein